MKFSLSDRLILDTEDPRVRAQGLRLIFLGESGSGKSHGLALLAEQAKQQGLQLVILDPHGEYWPFAEKFEDLLVVGGDNADLPLDHEATEVYAEAFRSGKSLDFDLKEYIADEGEYNRYAEAIIRALWKVQVNEPRPAVWLFEEAHIICPQEKTADVLRRVGLVKGIATGGRKFGVIMLLGSQRPAELHKTPLSQCWLRLFGKTTEARDRDAVKDYLRPLKDDALKHLRTGQFYAYGWFNEPTLIETFPPAARITKHGADTPLIAPIQRTAAREIANIGELRKMIEDRLKTKEQEQSEIASVRAKLAHAENQRDEYKKKADVVAVLKDLEAHRGLSHADRPSSPAALSPGVIEKLDRIDYYEHTVKSLQTEVETKTKQLEAVDNERKAFAMIREGFQLLAAPVAQATQQNASAASASASARLEQWVPKLNMMEKRIARFLAEQPDREFTPQDIAVAIAASWRGGAFQVAARKLAVYGLIQRDGNNLQWHP